MHRLRIRRLAPFAVLALIGSSLTGCVVATGSRGGSGGGSFFFLLLPLALVLLMARAGRRRRGARRRAWSDDGPGEDRDVRGSSGSTQVMRAELSVLADDVMRLEPHVALNEAARDDFEAATHRYRVVQAALEHAEQPIDLVRVQRLIDEANWAMSRVRAILDGRTPPEPPAALQRPGSHGEPAVRVDDRQRPVYVDSPEPFRSGWSSAGGGLFGGLLLGSMLGGFGGGWVIDDGSDAGYDDGVADPGDGGPDGW